MTPKQRTKIQWLFPFAEPIMELLTCETFSYQLTVRRPLLPDVTEAFAIFHALKSVQDILINIFRKP